MTDTRSRDERALSRFMGQMDAHEAVVEQIAENLHSEGVHSYARPLDATLENLREAFEELVFELGGYDLEAEVVELDVVRGGQEPE